MTSIIKAKSDNQIILSGEPIINRGNNHSSQTLFLCPTARLRASNYLDQINTPIDSSPYFHGIIQGNKYSDDYYKNHPVLPLFWCNNKNDFLNNDCAVCCANNKYGQNYYFCEVYDYTYHKECVESPSEIKHPYHPKHFLKLFYTCDILCCVHCVKDTSRMVYRCTLCNFSSIHLVCATEPISFVLDQPKRHEHPLTFFTRKSSLDCNVCGLTSEVHDPTYVCFKCNFIAHKDCANFPTIIRISRHTHRVSFFNSIPPGEWSCGICSRNVDSEYGGYICNKCKDYVVHTRCALRKDIWDTKELEGITEEEGDVEKNVDSFEIIKDGRILHFSHEHPLRSETSRVYDEMKICQACIIPIYEGDFYSCMECDFILHNTCANAPREKQHPLHPHLLTLEVINYANYICRACGLRACGFIYMCGTCNYKLDIRCASIFVPFNYQGHEHSLLLALSPGESQTCQACKRDTTSAKALNCIKCGFIICFNCVTLPYMARYKHDEHFLTLCFGDDKIRELYWCDVCEMKLTSVREERFYRCNYGCSTLHVDCLFGKDRYIKPGITRGEAQTFPNYTFSRPICDYCHRRCENKIIFRKRGEIYCSWWCT